MDSACPEKDATEILSDSDHSTKVAATTLSGDPYGICVVFNSREF